jgi:acyl transferase domain-containing protein
LCKVTTRRLFFGLTDHVLMTHPPGRRFSIFLDGVDLFDAATFAISDNEAVLMDPQQRLLLECTGEALMQAQPAAYAVTNAGVFVGECACLPRASYRAWSTCMQLFVGLYRH